MTGLTSLLNVINDSLFNVVLKNASTTGSFCNSVQDIHFKKLKLNKCKLTISQDTQTLCELQKIEGLRNKQELLSTINDSIDSISETSDIEASEFLATAISSNKAEMTMATYIKNLLEINITDEMLSSCIASSSVEQNLETSIILNCSNDPEKDNKIIQNVQIYQFVSCITSKISDIISNSLLCL